MRTRTYLEAEVWITDSSAEPRQRGVEPGKQRHEGDVVDDDDHRRLAGHRRAVSARLEHVRLLAVEQTTRTYTFSWR